MDIINFPDNRRGQIEFVLSGLSQLRPSSGAEKYAVEQNILFFESLRSVPSYVRWLYGARRNIRREDLLEINELLPDLDEIFHAKMAEIERRPRPGIIRPVVEHMTKSVVNGPQDKRFRMATLGSGSMEADRQVIEQFQGTENKKPLTIVGFDISQNTRAFAKKNLSALGNVRIVQESELTGERLAVLERETQEQVLVVIADNDIFTLLSDFQPHSFNLVMTALFLHHLREADTMKLVEDMRVLAPQTLNYDGYQSEVVIPVLSLTGWHSPVFLNAAIFSTIRFPSRTETLRLHPGAQIDFYKHGHYRAIFSS